MFKYTINNTVPYHKRMLEIDHGHTEVEVRRDGKTGILVSLEDVWQNASGKKQFYSRTVHAHLEREEALKLAQSIIDHFNC